MSRTGVRRMREARRHTTDGLLFWLKTAQPKKDESIKSDPHLSGNGIPRCTPDCVALACQRLGTVFRLRPIVFTYRANDRAQEIKVTRGKGILVPLVGLAEWKLKIRMASLNVEACARLPQNDLRTCPNILVVTH